MPLKQWAQVCTILIMGVFLLEGCSLRRHQPEPIVPVYATDTRDCTILRSCTDVAIVLDASGSTEEPIQKVSPWAPRNRRWKASFLAAELRAVETSVAALDFSRFAIALVAISSSSPISATATGRGMTWSSLTVTTLTNDWNAIKKGLDSIGTCGPSGNSDISAAITRAGRELTASSASLGDRKRLAILISDCVPRTRTRISIHEHILEIRSALGDARNGGIDFRMLCAELDDKREQKILVEALQTTGTNVTIVDSEEELRSSILSQLSGF